MYATAIQWSTKSLILSVTARLFSSISIFHHPSSVSFTRYLSSQRMTKTLSNSLHHCEWVMSVLLALTERMPILMWMKQKVNASSNQARYIEEKTQTLKNLPKHQKLFTFFYYINYNFTTNSGENNKLAYL